MKRKGFIMTKKEKEERRGFMNPVSITPCIWSPYDDYIQVRYSGGGVFYMPCDAMNTWYEPLSGEGMNMVIMTDEEA